MISQKDISPESSLKLSGHVTAVVRDAKTGKVIQTIKTPNKVVTTGLNLIGDLLKEDTAVGLNYFGVGTDNTAPVIGNTTLGAEVYRGEITTQSRASAVLVVTLFLPTTAANGSSLVEIGLFNVSSAGIMFSRAVHAAIAKTATVTVTYTWTFTFTSS